jgi:biopolymer transport protein ExbD
MPIRLDPDARTPGAGGVLSHFPIVPLISVVLLLLLALMLTSTIEPKDPVVVVPPAAAAATQGEHEPGTVLVDAAGRLARDGRLTDLEALAAEVARNGEERLRLLADRELRVGTLLAVRDRLAAAGARRLELVVERP